MLCKNIQSKNDTERNPPVSLRDVETLCKLVAEDSSRSILTFSGFLVRQYIFSQEAVCIEDMFLATSVNTAFMLHS